MFEKFQCDDCDEMKRRRFTQEIDDFTGVNWVSCAIYRPSRPNHHYTVLKFDK